MKRATNIVGLLLIFFGSLSMPLTSVAKNQAGSTNTPPMCNPAVATSEASTPVALASPSPVAIEFDQVYLDLMIAQQNRMRDLAKLGYLRAESPEVKQLADDLFSSTELIINRLRDTREAWFDDQSVLQDSDVMAALDEIGRLQPAVGGVPGAMQIVQSESVVMELCSVDDDFDVRFLTALIDQLDHGVLFSEAANELAGRDETKVIASLVIETDQPFKDIAIAFRDVLLHGSPIPEDD
jgi:uncharacterized protein (DUF305 family)